MSEPIALKRVVGDNIRSLRKAKKLSQEELGERAGLSYKFVGEIERGSVNPSLESLENIAVALEVDVARLALREGLIILSDSGAAEAIVALATLNRVICNPCAVVS
jgi:transcriptional regulator with XRE-family HTH domain